MAIPEVLKQVSTAPTSLEVHTINLFHWTSHSSLPSPCERELDSESQAGTNLGQASGVYQVLFLSKICF